MSNLTQIKNVMLISPKKVKEYAVVGLNLDEGNLGNAIRIAHIYLRDAIGKDLVEHVQELVYNKIHDLPNSIDDPENEPYKVLLDEYLQPTLVYRAAMESCTIFSFKIRNMGVVRNDDNNVKEAPTADVISLIEYYGVLFNDALNRCSDYLCENKKAIPEVGEDYCTCKSKPRFAQTNLWLG